MTKHRLSNRDAADASGFTLVELLVVLVVIGVLLAIAIPSFLGYEDRANLATAKANLRAAVPAVEAFRHANDTYDAATMTVAALRSFDQGLSNDIAVVSGSATTYCIRSTHGSASVYRNGPSASITTVACTQTSSSGAFSASEHWVTRPPGLDERKPRVECGNGPGSAGC